MKRNIKTFYTKYKTTINQMFEKWFKKIITTLHEKYCNSDEVRSKEDIHKEEDLDENYINYAIMQSEKMLKDIKQDKLSTYDKAFKLVTVQLSAIVAIATMIHFSILYVNNWMFIFLALAVFFSILAIKGAKYGSLGMHPERFLVKSNNMKSKYIKFMKGYLLVDYIDRINVSIRSNKIKEGLIFLSLLMMFVAIIILITSSH